jgi:HSP20 family protein
MSSNLEAKAKEVPARRWDWFDRDLGRWFEGMWPWFGGGDRLCIEQEMADDTMIVRAEVPGIDPDKDVEITLDDGVLRIRAERRYEESEEKQGRTRSEFRYGMFERSLRVPGDVGVDDVEATYRDGILEVKVPFKVPTEAGVRRVPVTKR